MGAFSGLAGTAYPWTLAGGYLIRDNVLQKLSVYSSGNDLYTDSSYEVLNVMINSSGS